MELSKEALEALDILKRSNDQTVAEKKEALRGETGARGPVGSQGPAGEAATVSVGSTVAVSSQAPARVWNSGNSPQHVILNFEIPRGSQGERGVAGRDSQVPGPKGDSGRDGKDSLVPGPRGAAGIAASVAVGKVETVAHDEPASVTNVGSSPTAVVLDFKLPRGAQGEPRREPRDGVDGKNGLTPDEIKDIVRATIIETMQNVGVMNAHAAKLVAVRVALKKKINECDARNIGLIADLIRDVDRLFEES